MGKYGFRKGKEREYASYRGMRTRVENPNHPEYKSYRCHRICDRWLGPSGFENFYNDLGPRPEGTTLDRLDNTLGYSPGNCAWRSPKQQGNNRSTNIVIKYNGKRMTISQWSEKLGIKYTTLYRRLQKGMPVSQAFTRPVRKTLDIPTELPNGLSRRTVAHRIRDLHWTREEAISTPKKKNQYE